jgi:hypothetical protein
MKFFTSLFLAFFFWLSAWGQSLFINEWMVSNTRTLAGPDGFPGWVEIYNAGPNTINLSGYYFSDNPAQPTKYRFLTAGAALNVHPGKHFLVWLGRQKQGCFNCVPLELPLSGGAIYLIHPDSVTVIDAVQYGQQYRDISMGRTIDGGAAFGYFQNATPKRPNQQSVAAGEVLSPPIIETPGGFYNQNVFVKITHPDPDAQILYTTDGSQPQMSFLGGQPFPYKNQWPQASDGVRFPMLSDTMRTFVFEDSIELKPGHLRPNHVANFSTSFDTEPWYIPQQSLQKGTVIRAVAVKEGAIASPVNSQTYFIKDAHWKAHELPVVSIATGNHELFDYNHGISTAGVDFENWRDTSNSSPQGNSPANWHREGSFYEIPVSLSFFDRDGSLRIAQEAGMRIHGGWTRYAPRKSFRLYARAAYGNNTLEHPFFSLSDHTSYKRLLLRNSGNDHAATLFRDAFMQNLVKHLNFDIQLSEPAVVYLNGEYQGLYNLREFQNHHYIERKYEVAANQLDLLGSNFEVLEGTSFQFIMMLSYMVNRDLSQPEHLEFVETLLDIPGFLEYVMAQVFIRNSDWPHNNVKVWRKRTAFQPHQPTGLDGRFRWMMYDTDHGFGLVGSNNGVHHNTLEMAYQTAQVGMMLQRLFENDSVKNWFGIRYQDLLNTCFRSDHIIRMVDSMEAMYRPEIPMQMSRWGMPASFENWQSQVERLRAFARARGLHARQHLSAQFDWSPPILLQLDVNQEAAGYCHINTVSLVPETPGLQKGLYPWVGMYVPDVPIVISAHAYPGFEFGYWIRGTDTLFQDTLQFSLQQATSIKAFFLPTIEDCSSQLGYQLAECPYVFDHWSPSSLPGSAPSHAAFVYFDRADPPINAPIAGITSGAFNLESRTRILGLGLDGVAFVNTGNAAGNPGYPGGQLGGLLLTVDTRDLPQAWVSWIGRTHERQSRVYEIRLQYRIGQEGPFLDLLDVNGFPMVYRTQMQPGDAYEFPPVALPAHLLGRSCVQLLWRYAYTGQRRVATSGARDILGVKSIRLAAVPFPEDFTALFPTPDFSGPEQVLAGDTSQWASHMYMAGSRFQWTVKGGEILGASNASVVKIYWQEPGMGSVTLELVLPDGCRWAGRKDVAVKSGFEADATEEFSASLFPNPNDGTFKVAFAGDPMQQVDLSIFDITARLLHQEYLMLGREHQISLNLPSGIYLLVLREQATGKTHTSKFEVR